MQTRSYVLFALFICLTTFLSYSTCIWADITYTAGLSTTQVVPTPNDPPSTQGAGFCTYIPSAINPTLSCRVQHDVKVATLATIGVAPRNVLGSTVYTFSNIIGTNQFFEETFVIVNQTDYTIEEQINDYLNGLWYINVASDDYPDGVIRGQLENNNRGYALLSVNYTVPRATGSTASGIALVNYSPFDPVHYLSFYLIHNVLYPTGTQLNQGRPGQVGSIIYEFDQFLSPFSASLTLTADEQGVYYSDLYYLNILSSINPSGEIRGQMVTVDYVDELAFTSRLSNLATINDTSNHSGCALIGYDCEQRLLQLLIMHNIPDCIGGYLAAPIVNNGETTLTPILFLTSYSSPIFMSAKLTPTQANHLFNQEVVIILLSTAYPEGEIQGTISVEYDFYAYLSGSNVVPPVTTAGVGCVTMSLSNQNSLDYAIFHSVVSPTEINFYYGNEGQNGVVAEYLSAVASPVKGSTQDLNSQQLRALIYDQIYIEINSLSYPFTGEVRGQIKRVNPCSISVDNYFSLVKTSLAKDGGGYLGGNDSSSASSLFSFFSVFVVAGLLLCLFFIQQ